MKTLKTFKEFLNERSTPSTTKELIVDPASVRELVLASGRANIDKVEELLTNNVDPNEPDTWGEYAIERAIKNPDSLSIVKMLLAYGADPTAITYKSLKHSTRQAFDLVKGDIAQEEIYNATAHNIRDDDYASAYFKLDSIKKQEYLDSLLYASFLYCERCISTLIERGANINAVDAYSGLTPLMRAVKSNDTQRVRKIIYLGADVSIKGKYKKTAKDYLDTKYVGYDDIKKLIEQYE